MKWLAYGIDDNSQRWYFTYGIIKTRIYLLSSYFCI